MLFPKSWGGNAATRYGKQTESMVKLVCERTNNVVIQETGLIIPAHRPWTCYSPDGIIVLRRCLIEIKCPVKGQTMTAYDVLKFCQFITFDSANKPQLKKRHPYYGQVQLGMFLLNLQTCRFLVYASFDRTYADIEVPRDNIFLGKFIDVLDKTYFDKVLPYLYSNYERLLYFKPT